MESQSAELVVDAAPSPVVEKKQQKKQRRAKTNAFKACSKRILMKVDKKRSYSGPALNLVAALARDAHEQVAMRAASLMNHCGRTNLRDADLIRAIKMTLPPKLAQQASILAAESLKKVRESMKVVEV